MSKSELDNWAVAAVDRERREFSAVGRWRISSVNPMHSTGTTQMDKSSSIWATYISSLRCSPVKEKLDSVGRVFQGYLSAAAAENPLQPNDMPLTVQMDEFKS